jgi:hypothetical protein
MHETVDEVYWTLLVAHDAGIDLEKAYTRKMVENAGQYPVEASRGRSGSYGYRWRQGVDAMQLYWSYLAAVHRCVAFQGSISRKLEEAFFHHCRYRPHRTRCGVGRTA